MINIDLEALKKDIEGLSAIQALEELRIKYLGKQGIIGKEFQNFAKLPPEDRKTLGEQLNKIKQEIASAIDSRINFLEASELELALRTEAIDITLPAREKTFGSIHPISYVSEEIAEIFANMGFKIVDGPEVDNEYYNFTALNFPINHPAKEMHDTFYVQISAKERMLLRTHTSTVQIREMERSKPPFKFITLGKTYRCDYDATHTPMFQQVECLYIDKNITMAHLKSCMYDFVKAFFPNKNVGIRFRPSFFPFTEPSGELDIMLDEGGKWLEILGCGMVHPAVLKNVNIDPKVYQGFAFGMGVERCAMLKYKISDCRAFYEGDIRQLKNNGFQFFNIPRLVDKVLL